MANTLLPQSSLRIYIVPAMLLCKSRSRPLLRLLCCCHKVPHAFVLYLLWCCAGDAAGNYGQHAAATKLPICSASEAGGHAHSTGECSVSKICWVSVIAMSAAKRCM
jgi:hypothetical protein